MKTTWLILALVAWPSIAGAQAWTRDQGSFYVKLGYATLSTEEAYGPDFESDSIRPYSQHILSLYTEVGLIDRWLTLVASGELYRRNRLDEQGYTEGLGDLQAGLFTGLVDAGNLRLSLGVLVGLPTGDSDPAPDDDSDPLAHIIAASLPTGDGEVDVEWRAAFGWSVYAPDSWPLSHYFVADLGYWLRTDGFSDAITYRAELGSQVPGEVGDRFWLAVRVRGVESFASEEEVAMAAFGIGNGVTATYWGAELMAAIGAGLGLSFGVEDPLRGRATTNALVFNFGLSLER